MTAVRTNPAAATPLRGSFFIYYLIILCKKACDDLLFGFLFFLRALPETKGKSLETLEKDLIK